jgi:MoxR-like ATPase
MASVKDVFDQITAQASQIILGKERQIRLVLACLLTRGHVLIEDLPGVGKTTLAHTLARVLRLSFQRIQFTSDLLPADIIGVSIFDHESSQFKFHQGPIFAQMVLADEINRATPKTQSALLEAMEEQQVTVEGVTRPLPAPFFVLATQNPTHQIGTFPLPESQLDRFTMRIALGYPDSRAERALLRGRDRRSMIGELPQVLDTAELLRMQEHLAEVKASDALLDYIQALLEFTRQSALYRNGLSPRAGVSILRSAQAWALLQGREFVTPEDVQAVLPAVAGHRLASVAAPRSPEAITADLLEQVAVP